MENHVTSLKYSIFWNKISTNVNTGVWNCNNFIKTYTFEVIVVLNWSLNIYLNSVNIYLTIYALSIHFIIMSTNLHGSNTLKTIATCLHISAFIFLNKQRKYILIPSNRKSIIWLYLHTNIILCTVARSGFP